MMWTTNETGKEGISIAYEIRKLIRAYWCSVAYRFEGDHEISQCLFEFEKKLTLPDNNYDFLSLSSSSDIS